MLPVLTTKLQTPQLPENFISRTMILKDSHKASVILVSAQAGSGKSTIISAWLKEQNKTHCWYSLDEWDNDLIQFFTYLIKAFNTVDDQSSEKLDQMLDAIQSIGIDGFLKGLVQHLHTINVPFILVFDDYQVIQNKLIHHVLKTLVEHIPQMMQLVVITREDPQLPLAKLRANKKLLEIRISDLKFTEIDARAFFIQHLNFPILDEHFQLIYKRTEGWIAGLQLVALSLSELEDKNSFIEAFTGSHYYVMDYLIEEVLDIQMFEIKDFLLKTSILDLFSGELCDAVVKLESGHSREIINRLVRANIFIIPMDSTREWYRYHHLFRDLLRQRLEQQAKEDIKMLHRCAGDWFMTNNHIQEAIQHYLKAEAFAEAAELIECKWSSMDMQLQSASWLGMAKLLPELILERSPVLMVGYGWALLDMGDIEHSEVWINKAQKIYDQYKSTKIQNDILINDTIQFDLLPATIASARAYIAASNGDMEGIFKHTHEALQHLPCDQYQSRSIVTMLLSFAHWGLKELDIAETYILQSIDNAKRAESPLTYNSFCMMLGELYIQQEKFDKATNLFEQTISRVVNEHQVPIILASLYLGLAKISFLQEDNQRAYTQLENSKQYGQKYSLMDWNYKYYLMLARVYCKEGFIDLAKDCLKESRTHYFMSPIPDDFSFEEMDIAIELAEKTHSLESLTLSNKNNKIFLQEHMNRFLVEPLTVRELEVLSLIALGLSNNEICNKLFLALSTVKGYNQTIYGKLQVKRRTEAVIKATALGLA